MYNRIELLQLPPDLTEAGRQQWLERVRQGATAAELLLQRTLPGVYNGGEVLLKLRGADRQAVALTRPVPPPVHADCAVYQDGEGGGDWSRRGVYRALLLSLRPQASAAAVARFEREILAMPRYIRSIRGWRLSRVLESAGARPWSHVWEQRYDDLEGLAGPYMMHPYHWAYVDRWFDPESPDWMVDTHLCHSYCRFE
jgi:hypothetical protein